MGTDRPVAGRSRSGRRLLPDGGSAPTLAGAAVVVILLAAVSATTWYAMRSHQALRAKAGAERVRTAGELLAKTAEALLAANEVSALRRIIVEAGEGCNLDSCRVVLPDGQVIADSDPARITLAEVPDSWSGPSADYKESVTDEAISVSWPLEVSQRGAGRLEIAATTAGPLWTAPQVYTGLGVITALSLAALLLVCRYARSRFRAIEAIRQALLAADKGVESQEALAVSPGFGPEARAWNRLLAGKAELEKRSALKRATETLESGCGANGDLGAMCDAMTQGLVLVDGERRVKYVNGAASVFLQGTREGILGADLSQFIGDERVLEPIRRVADGETHERSIVEVERDGSAGGGILRFVIRPVRRSDAGVAMIVIEDITQRRVAEEARNTFLAKATHELRTPLTNIRLYVETALEEGEDDPAARAKCLNSINAESGRLERIVSDILSVSEIEAGSFRIRRDDVPLDVLLEQLKADYEPQAKERRINLSFDLPPKLPVLHGDRDKIVIALHNLLGNALKYTPEGGQVTVSVTVDKHQVSFDVADTGIGIGESETEKVFEKFYRAVNATAAGTTGSGMGLALAREIVRLHGGDITVQSEPERGSTFTLTMPVSQEAA